MDKEFLDMCDPQQGGQWVQGRWIPIIGDITDKGIVTSVVMTPEFFIIVKVIQGHKQPYNRKDLIFMPSSHVIDAWLPENEGYKVTKNVMSTNEKWICSNWDRDFIADLEIKVRLKHAAWVLEKLEWSGKKWE